MCNFSHDQIEKTWITCPLTEIYKIIGGGTPSTKVQEYWEGSIPWITSADIQGLENIAPRKNITEKAIQNSAANVVPKDSIIVVTRVGLGKVGLTKEILSFSQDCQGLVANDGLVFPKYALYYLSEAVKSFQTNNRGTTISGVTKKQLKELPFVLPPLNEQHQIVSKIEELFSELDSATQSLKKAQEQLKTYRQSVLKHAFEGKLTEAWRKRQKEAGNPPESAEKLLERIKQEREEHYQKQLAEWEKACEQAEAEGTKKPTKPKKPKDLPPLTKEELADLPELPEGWAWVKLGNLSNIVGGVTKGRKLYNKETSELYYLRVANVQDGYLDLSNLKKIEIPKEEEQKYLLEYGDLLYTEGGDKDKLGRGTVWKNQVYRCIHQNHIFRARLISKDLLSLYFAYFTSCNTAKTYFFSNAKQTVNLASINITILSNLPVPITCAKEQSQITSEIESRLSVCDQLEKSIEDSLNKTEALRQSILKKAFSGELTKEWREAHPELISGENSAEKLLERIKAEKKRMDSRKATKNAK
jgi:type I restriction enzyme S subunit